MLGALDYMTGGRFGLGKEFQRGFSLLFNMALCMIGMLVLTPLICSLVRPVSDILYTAVGIDPSVIPASLLANDMGGAPLAKELAKDASVGGFHALVTASMMGTFLSYTLPYALGVVKKEHHADMFLGMLCGVVTIPIGCFISGLMCRISAGVLLYNLLPLIVLAALIGVGLALCPMVCVRIFTVLGMIIRIIITAGLALGIINSLAGSTVIPGIAPLSDGALVCVNAALVLSGAFPFMFVLSKLLKKPLSAAGRRLGIGDDGAMGLLSTVITNATTFEIMNGMNRKAVILNAAFTVSAAFTLGAHLAYTMAFDGGYILPVTAGKLTAGAASLVLAVMLAKKSGK